MNSFVNKGNATCSNPCLGKSLAAVFSIFALGALITSTTPAYARTHSISIQIMSMKHVPVPIARPNITITASKIDQTKVSSIHLPDHTLGRIGLTYGSSPKIMPISGSLKSGLDSLKEKDVQKALGIRAGLPAGSLDRKILAWAIAMSGRDGIPAAQIYKISHDLNDWPGQKYMRANFEKALAFENLRPDKIIAIFSNDKPKTIDGALVLAKAYLARGQKKTARSIIAPFWWKTKLSEKQEKAILRQIGNVLSRADHRRRMHAMFYNDRTKAGMRMAGLAEQSSLAKARKAVVQKSSKAKSYISKVAASSRKDTAFLFTQIEYARRNEDFRRAAKLLGKQPKEQWRLVNPDEWWTERRIIGRDLLDHGKAKQAYKLVSKQTAKSRAARIDAEFHSGFFALRYLKNAKLARSHFSKILELSSRPISQARGYYWLGRASSGKRAKQYYRSAAVYAGTYYGQLAAQKIGIRKLKISKPKPSTKERSRFASRELVRAIKRLESSGYASRADLIYRYLAQRLNSTGELALLSARAEKRGNPSLALQVGKLAYYRGLDVDTLAWPIGAIPSNAKIGLTGKALAYAIARQESAFNKSAVSHANARGLLQLLPGTAKQVAKAKGIPYSYKRLTSDASYNATLGAAYLSKQLDDFKNSYVLTIAGYNAGPRKVEEWMKRYGDPTGKSIEFVVDWIERIPYTETRNYVQRVMENYQIYKTRLANAPLNIERDLRFGRR